MLKKIYLGFFILLSLFFLERNFVYSDSGCESTGSGICGTEFTINMGDISPRGTGNSDLKGTDSQETINKSLGNIIKKLMIVLTMVALFIMTIGAGYIIMYHGQDEYLTKGKNIFIAGILTLVVALSSYYLISLLTYILYK